MDGDQALLRNLDDPHSARNGCADIEREGDVVRPRHVAAVENSFADFRALLGGFRRSLALPLGVVLLRLLAALGLALRVVLIAVTRVLTLVALLVSSRRLAVCRGRRFLALRLSAQALMDFCPSVFCPFF